MYAAILFDSEKEHYVVKSKHNSISYDVESDSEKEHYVVKSKPIAH